MSATAIARHRPQTGWPATTTPLRTSATPDLQSIAGDGIFEGYASLFHREDLGHDVVLPGAFRDTLRKRGTAGVRLLFQHDPATPIGVWDLIREDARGLYVRGRLTLGVERAREVLALMRAGAVDGLSIGFKTVRARADRARGLRLIEKVDLWEISVVTFPLLPDARITAVAQQTAPLAIRSISAKFGTPPLATRGHAQQISRTAEATDDIRDTARRLMTRIERRNRDLARCDHRSHTTLSSSIAGDRVLLALTRTSLIGKQATQTASKRGAVRRGQPLRAGHRAAALFAKRP